jgi:hypothetical protein
MPGTTEKMMMQNMGNAVIAASIRGTRVWATWQDCRKWEGDNICTWAVRVAEIEVGETPKVIKERTFGKHHKGETGKSVSYGAPGVMATKAGDAVVVYNRSSGAVYPEARYTLWHHGEADVRPSAVLATGSTSPGFSSTNPTTWNSDMGGAALDPDDEQTVWIAHVHSVKGTTTNISVGKVTVH